jgi:predicted ATP-dependent endonuclease of OLD family
MVLKSILIQNFKSIMDSETFGLDEVTCLVGKNESGKTAILQAISKIKPVAASEANFADLDFPRMTYADYTDNDRPKDILTTTWELEHEDVEALELRLGKGMVLSKSVSFKKRYANTLEWEVGV